MLPFDKIKSHYKFDIEDIRNLERVRPVFEKRKEEFGREFRDAIKHFEDYGKFIKNEAVLARHRESLEAWFMDLFSGNYGEECVGKLEKVGAVHVKVGLPSHYVNAAMNFVEQFCLDTMESEYPDGKERLPLLRSISKIIGINLDIITDSYVAEEVGRVFIIQRLENALIKFSKKFSYWLNLVLVIGLVIMGGLAIGLFVYDLSHILDGQIEKGLLSTLGSLLMLWMVIELIDTEIRHIQGGKFAVKVFVGVALVAVIRKTLIMTLTPGDTHVQIFLVVSLAVLAGSYWLISRVE